VGHLEPVEGCWADAHGIRVYFPRPGLFRDLLGADLYPDVPAARADADLVRDVEDALALVRAYDERLHDEVRRCFSVLVLTTDFGTVRSSFNLRLRYLGGLFLNPFHETPLGLAEGLVHEYYHQRLWHWWWEEPLDGLPGEDVQVTSPLTGRRRPVPVMTHALLIYVALQSMHATLARRLEADVARAAEARSERLAAAIGPLGDALRQAVPAGTRASSFLELLGRLRPEASVDAEGKLG
jgi:HEXXH motif-containing protein